MAETFTNNAATTLSAPITAANATVCNVASAAGFPTTGNFRIKIDNEICLVIEVVGTQFMIARGQENTTPVTHSNGVAVVHVLTKGALEARTTNMFVSDIYANKPLAGIKGRLFQPTDGFYLEYDDGAAWHKYGPCNRLKPPPVTGWSWVNKGNATVTHTGNALILEDPDMDAYTTQLRLYVRPLTGSGLVSAAFAFNGIGTNYGQGGMCYRQSGGTYDGRISAFSISHQAGQSYIARKEFTSPTATSGSASTSWTLFPTRVVWTKYAYYTDGTTKYCMMSLDGVNYKYFTNATSHTIYPNQCGIYIDPTNNAQKFSISLVHWEES